MKDQLVVYISTSTVADLGFYEGPNKGSQRGAKNWSPRQERPTAEWVLGGSLGSPEIRQCIRANVLEVWQDGVLRATVPADRCTINTRSSAVAERPRAVSCLSVVSFNIPTARFLPRDAMQARSMLSCSVRPSVCLSVCHVRGSRQNE